MFRTRCRAAAWLMVLPPLAAGAVDFNREVRPILSDLCFSCHGFDPAGRKAELRLDERESALAAGAVVPGDPDHSELLRRLASEDPEERMPPAETGKRASAAQIETLRRWIAAGAPYDTHWSFKPLAAAPPPPVTGAGWVRNGIDRFVLAALEAAGQGPAPEADPATLLRRVTFDLTGLPPTFAEREAFFADREPGAYERAVERLLQSSHYGERMAVDWLDAARYADTNGYFGDKTREIWPWRDWVVRAFNDNQPFDTFTIEQLAGDLLPGPTADRRIATGFNRNHMVTNESGAIDEEYRVEYVADRLETTGAVWLGLTVGCARCHDHKYDPLSQRDYYRLFAYFNQAVEKGLVSAESPPPVLEVPDPDAAATWGRLQAAHQEAAAAFDAALAPHREAFSAWEAALAATAPTPPAAGLARWHRFEPGEDDGARVVGSLGADSGIAGQAGRFDGMQHAEWPADTALEADRPWTIGWWMKPDGSLSGVIGKIEPRGRRRGFEVYWQKGRVHAHLVEDWGVKALEVALRDPLPGGRWHHLALRCDGSRRAAGLTWFVNGRPVPAEVKRDTLEGSIANAEPFRIGRRDDGLGYYGLLDELRLYDRALGGDEIRAWWWGEQARALLAVVPDRRGADQRQLLLETFVADHPETGLGDPLRRLVRARAAEEAFRGRLPRTLVMEEVREPRETRVLARGQYDQPGERVSPGVPAFLPPLPEGAPANRLGLARWLVSAEQPLTPRVAANRLWRQAFGEGLVKTVEDFGFQGEPPSHPALLDWLARRLVESGWDQKALLRLIVTSATYRQSSVPTPEGLAADPENRLLARGPRFRLTGEMIRDQALAASGLLSRRLGGPGVMPYQPAGLWEEVTYDGEEHYRADRGDGLWRRSLYTFWKRQLPPPAMQTFDGPTREKCTLRRARTNTPLQALVLLNDLTYLEAGRALADRVWDEAPEDDRARLRRASLHVLSREPTEREIAILADLLAFQRGRFRAEPAAAAQVVGAGASPAGRDRDPVELAAWTVTLHSLFTLDEALTRR